MTPDERTLIRSAMERLLKGAPIRSSGELTVVSLVVEAGPSIKRHHLTHKHTDLKDEFNASVRSRGFIPESEKKLSRENAELKSKLRRRVAEVTDLERQLEIVLRHNNALTLDRDRLLNALEVGSSSRVTAINRRPRHDDI